MDNYSEILFEMASVRPKEGNTKFGVLLAVNPDLNKIGDCYFKMYNSNSYITATGVWRICFSEPKLIKEHSGKIKSLSTINLKYKKILIEYLNSPGAYSGRTVWDSLKWNWNNEHDLCFEGYEPYFNGQLDEQNKNNKNYLPSTLEIPNYNELK